ncbi:MAG: cyclic nucleotide-binding domain-containing protein [Acidobacteria bacterium]|nr:cyclic nucleotide-binding domain-containing protein [Acidobacteriota bacterium]
MPHEITKHSEVLKAIEGIGSISDLTAKHDGHFAYEIDLEVIVYGRNYNGKQVGPYIRLLEYTPGEVIVREGDWGGNNFYIIVSGSADVLSTDDGRLKKISEIPEGVQFGELSVLAGVPRAATVCAPEGQSVKVLEVQRPALRLLRKLPKFGEYLDNTFRRHGRAATIKEIKSVTELSDEAVKNLESISRFRVYTKNHVLYRAGEQIRNLYLLRSGWARLAPRTEVTHIAITDSESRNWNAKSGEIYSGKWHCFGVEAITRDREWEQNCTLLGRCEVLEISLSQLRQYPELRETLLLAFTRPTTDEDLTRSRQPFPIARAQEDLIETGLVEATNLLVMDMEMCVRCGNCSMACHQVHGQSRLLRRGIHITRPESLKAGSGFQSMLAPSVCMHCKDPECLTGCPTGAIGRFPGGQVDIDHKTCIGCADCATQCPYNAISMIPRKAKNPPQPTGLKSWFRLSPDPLPKAVEQTDDLLAVKCNLCAGTGLNPDGAARQAYSCEENCPTGALLRVDPRIYFSEIRNIESLAFKDSTHAVLRHTSHREFARTIAHAIGLLATIILTALTILGMFRYGLETPLVGSWLDLRWITGIVGLIGVAGVMTYPVRRRIYKKRAWPLRFWMLAHSYLGVIAGILLLLHGGRTSGGALTTALMISFDLVVLTGLFGILIYYFVPRLLTRLEGNPLLIEDLTGRREELGDEIGAVMAGSSNETRSLIQKNVLPGTLSIGFLLRQYFRREELSRLIEDTKLGYSSIATGLSGADRENFDSALEKAVTIRRVDALIYLHQLLKLWLAPHVIFTSLMLALMVVHLIQVVYFAAR